MMGVGCVSREARGAVGVSLWTGDMSSSAKKSCLLYISGQSRIIVVPMKNYFLTTLFRGIICADCEHKSGVLFAYGERKTL